MRLPTSPSGSVAFLLAALVALGSAGPALAAGPAAGPVSVVSIIAHTPLWAWAVLAGLLVLGFAGTRPRKAGIAGIVIFPMVLLVLSLANLVSNGLAFTALAGLGVGGLLGAAAGLTLERRYAPTPLGRGRLLLRGEWTTLVVVLAVFANRYVSAVLRAMDPALAASDGFGLVTAGVSAFFAFLLLTRIVVRLRLALTPIAFA